MNVLTLCSAMGVGLLLAGCTTIPVAEFQSQRSFLRVGAGGMKVASIRYAPDKQVRMFLSRLGKSEQRITAPPWIDYNAEPSPRSLFSYETRGFSDVRGADGVDLSVLLNSPLFLPNGTRIDERWSKDVSGLAWATCDGLKPVIVYDLASVTGLTALSFQWFREHEYAHHLRGHVTCRFGNPIFKTGIQWERDADCHALKKLFERGAIERDVRIAVSERFFISGKAETLFHPSERERAGYIRRGTC